MRLGRVGDASYTQKSPKSKMLPTDGLTISNQPTVTYKAACTILNIGFCLNLLVVVVNLVVDGIAVAVLDFVIGSVVVVGGIEGFTVVGDIVLAGEKDYRKESKQCGRWE